MRAKDLLTGFSVEFKNSSFSDIVVWIDQKDYFIAKIKTTEDSLLFIETTDIGCKLSIKEITSTLMIHRNKRLLKGKTAKKPIYGYRLDKQRIIL